MRISSQLVPVMPSQYSIHGSIFGGQRDTGTAFPLVGTGAVLAIHPRKESPTTVSQSLHLNSGVGCHLLLRSESNVLSVAETAFAVALTLRLLMRDCGAANIGATTADGSLRDAVRVKKLLVAESWAIRYSDPCGSFSRSCRLPAARPERSLDAIEKCWPTGMRDSARAANWSARAPSYECWARPSWAWRR